MGRIQKGYIYAASGAFFCRYYVTEIVDGQAKRVQRSERLCSKDDKHYAPNAKAVKLLRDKFMLTINEQVPGHVNAQDVKIIDFWENTYLPFVKKNLRASSVHGYEKIWKQHLKLHFADLTLRQYRTHTGSQFLTGLAGKDGLGRRTLAHIRSLASGIFSHAVNTGLIDSNPWHDVKILGKVKEPKGSAHYTLDQAVKMIAALEGQPDCQAILALSCFVGLRPGEIAGLKWEDIDDNKWIHIRRAVVLGKEGETKTKIKAAADQLCTCGLPLTNCQRLPLIAPVYYALQYWKEKSADLSSNWIFPNRMGKPVDLASLARRIIIPILESKGIQFKGFYPGRRGAATILTELTGSAIAAQQLLRHQDLAVTTKNYVQQMPEAMMSGIGVLEERVTAAFAGVKLLEAAAANGK